MPIDELDGFDPVEEVISDIRNGKLVIVTDDEDRENEGDLIGAAEMMTPAMVNFMITEGRGMLCAPVSEEIAGRLKLGPMVAQNRDTFRTNYTVTVDAAKGVTTGVSAQDRAATIRILADPVSSAGDLVQPGHVNPLVARAGGVLRRAGHTEAAVDLARLAGLREAGALIEILSADGSPMRLPELRPFAKKHGLKLTSIAALIAYRRRSERLVSREQVIQLPTDWGDFQLYLYKSVLDGQEHLALVMGDVSDGEPVMVRVHSECLTGDVFGSQRCDCGWQLETAMRMIQAEGRGVIVYLDQEGRGIGLLNKLKAYELQDKGADTVEANEQLGFKADLRNYGIGAQILLDQGLKSIRVLTNNPRKLVGLDGYGLIVNDRVRLEAPSTDENASYLETKRTKLGHLFAI